MRRLSEIRLVIAILCFIYAIFACGFAFGNSLTETMLASEARILRPDISFSADGTSVDYADLLIRFSVIALCIGIFILITQTKRKLAFEILALLLLLLVVHRLVFFPSPGYLPGQTLRESLRFSAPMISLDFSFLVLLAVLFVVQILILRRAFKERTLSES